MTHREAIKEWQSKILIQEMNVIDWGSGSKPAFRYVDQRSTYKKYITIDKADGIPEDRKRNHLKKDITDSFLLHPCDIAFCIEVVEHVRNPKALLGNIRVNIKEGGTLYMTFPFTYPIHGDEDFWRFTAQGVDLLLIESGFQIEDIQETPEQKGYMVKAIAI